MTQAETWRGLLRSALTVLDTLPPAATEAPRWVWGGGTVLAYLHRHRVSRDVDIFLHDPQLLTYLSPRLNEASEALTTDYVEMSHFLKLRLAQGEIDFIIGPRLTDLPLLSLAVDGRHLPAEHPVEVVAKKLFYRGDSLAARDLFDVTLVMNQYPDLLQAQRPLLITKREAILTRIATTDALLAEAFKAIETLEFTPSYEHSKKCLRVLLE